MESSCKAEKFEPELVLRDAKMGNGKALDSFRTEFIQMGDSERRQALSAMECAIAAENKSELAKYWSGKGDKYSRIAIDTSETEEGIIFSAKINAASLIIADKNKTGKVSPEIKSVNLYATPEGKDVQDARKMVMPLVTFAMTMELAGNADDVSNILKAAEKNEPIGPHLKNAGRSHKDQWQREEIHEALRSYASDYLTENHPHEPEYRRELALDQLQKMLHFRGMNEARELQRRAVLQPDALKKITARVQEQIEHNLGKRTVPLEKKAREVGTS